VPVTSGWVIVKEAVQAEVLDERRLDVQVQADRGAQELARGPLDPGEEEQETRKQEQEERLGNHDRRKGV
jgi:hypothetical protein